MTTNKRTTSATDPRSGLLPELEEPPEGAPKSAIFYRTMVRARSLGMTLHDCTTTSEGARLYARYITTDDLASIAKAALDSGDPAAYFRRNLAAYRTYRKASSMPVGPKEG